ncbi:hypothetical protein GA0074695_3587 [Micromonospora viridifaciens]|uniref:Ig-like domain (Group 3) n=1 Tax=Micromonospora viridifaciens TaxID=1881 RepID=A0A1C4XT82_MICVI|nr:hypothetical protein [Micromonospora viridifaciens]SCF11703.1 hypothetical protein GA0074695_3587 [Micromonospora viridifaciens]
MRRARPLMALAALCLVAPAAPAAAAAPASADPPASAVYAEYTGELPAGQQGTVALNLAREDYTPTRLGPVLVGFTLDAAPDSALDPGKIVVRSKSGPPPFVSVPFRHDTPGSKSSYTVAALTPGSDYEVLIRSEKYTSGAYRLSASLAGDANADFQVNHDDLTLIDSLAGARYGSAKYSPSADVDRNGIINRFDRLAAAFNLGAATRLRLTVENPLDTDLPAGALTLADVSPTGFNAVSAPVTFNLAGADFYDDAAETTLTVNDKPVPADRVTVDRDRVTATTALADGRNDLRLTTVDALGRPLYHQATVWAGSNTLRVTVVDEAGAPVTDPVVVRVSLTDDQDVHAEQTTATGQAAVPNVPSRTVLVKATASGNRQGIAGLYAGDGSVRITLRGFAPPSTIANNDFSQGTAGWNTGTAPVTIKPHVEGIPGTAPAGLAASRGNRTAAPAMTPAEPSTTTTDAPAATSIVDNDLTLGTAGEGEQSISRAFATDADVSAVRIRYRFITSEVPGGYFGSEWNDYFRVSLRSQQGGGSAVEANSMNGLGLGQFDYGSGATGWRDLTLPVDKAGDTIQVDLGVANVGDGLYDSQVVVDFVEEVRDQIRPSLAWNNTAGGMNLTYTVENGDLKQAGTIDVYWANGTGHANRLGAPIFSQSVPAGTTAGSHGPIHIAGNLLADNPAGVTHLIAVASPSRVGALADVQVAFGPNANAAVLRPATIDIVKDSLRAAGQRTVTITSTARTPADQARAMFQNLTNAANPVNVNVNNQLALYAAPGDAVINVFVQQTQGLTRQQILANGAAIRAAMEQEINNQGPQNVSRHCADPATVNVADLGAGVFNATNGPLFVNAIRPRVTRFIDERNSNGCYHIEIQ